MWAHVKRFWKAISTGWVIEYPDPNNGPSDFFDRKNHRLRQGERPPRYQEREESNEDAVFKWSEQMRAIGR
jgi:hypothetical protein